MLIKKYIPTFITHPYGVKTMFRIARKTEGQLLRLYSSQYKVLHNAELKEFSLDGEKEKAVLQYKQLTPSLIELEHTIVPESLQGKGLGKLLAEAAFEYAIDRKFTVKVTCGFVQKYLEKNPKPEFKSVLAK
ncbi:UNVERIFIED_CONTAM: natd1 [Trichonephila clavipes]